MKARIESTGEIVEIKDLYDDGTASGGKTCISRCQNLIFLVKTLIGNKMYTNWQKKLWI